MIIEEKGGTLLVTKELAEGFKVDSATGDIILLISTEIPDGDGDVVHQRRSKHGAGWLLKRFNGAPVISWQHNLQIPNLSGPRTRAKQGKHATKGQALFLDPLQFDEGDVFAMELDGKYRREVLKESSVGFRIHQYQPRIIEGKRVGMDIYEQELIETAAVNRGANPETETMAKALLMRAGGSVETAGDAEAKEILEILDALRGDVTVLANELKSLGDKVDGEESDAVKLLGLDERTKLVNGTRAQAAKDLLAALKRVGTAHG